MIWSTWMIAAGVLLVLEIVSPGTFFFICLAIGAVGAGIVSLITMNLWIQVIVFTIISVASMYFVRPFAKKYFNQTVKKSNVDALIGKTAVVVEQIEPLRSGMIKIDGDLWRAECDNTVASGEQVEITAIDGTKLMVKKKK